MLVFSEEGYGFASHTREPSRIGKFSDFFRGFALSGKFQPASLTVRAH